MGHSPPSTVGDTDAMTTRDHDLGIVEGWDAADGGALDADMLREDRESNRKEREEAEWKRQ